MKYNKLVLFDIDRTLIEGSSAHINAFSRAIERVHGIKVTLDFRLDGLTDIQIIMKMLEKKGLEKETISSKIHECIREIVKEYLVNSYAENMKLLPGVKDLLEELRNQNILIGLVTGNIEDIAWHKLERAGIREYFSLGGFGNEGFNRKDLIKVAIEKAEKMFDFTHHDNIFLVGDIPLDIKAGKEAKVTTIGVATGIFSKEDLEKAGANFVLSILKDIDDFLRIVID